MATGRKIHDRLMERPSAARVSSASTDSEYVLATVPFGWEAAPGRPADSTRKSVESSSLPLPPGRRPRDGFFLPIPRPAQASELHFKDGGTIPGSAKKNLFRSRKPRKSHVHPDAGSIFDPLSGHRFGSRVTRRVLEESQKSPSCFRWCLPRPAGRKAPAGLDPEDENFVTPDSSPRARDPVEAGAGTPSGRFNMATMLLSLCSESDVSDEGDGIGDETGDEAHVGGHLATPRAAVPGSCRSGRIQQGGPGDGDLTTMSDRRGTIPDANCDSAPPEKEFPQSAFAWKSRDQPTESLDPLAASVTTKAEESESANCARPECGHGDEEIGPRGSCSSLARNYSERRALSDCSSSSPKFVRSGPNDAETVLPHPAARSRAESLSMPRSSCGSSDCSFTTVDKSPRRRGSSEQGSEPNQATATPPIPILPRSRQQDQPRLLIATSKDSTTEDKRARSNSPSWLDELKASSLWPSRAPKTSPQGDAGDKSGDETEIPAAAWPKPAPNTDAVCSPKASPKPATWVVSEDALQSSTLLKCKLQRQQSHESPRSSFSLDQEAAVEHGPSPVTAPTAPDETHADTPDDGSKGDSFAVRPTGGLSEASEANNEAQGETRVGAASAGKSVGPIYIRRRGSTIIASRAVSSDDGSGEDSEKSSMGSSRYGTPRGGSPTSSQNSVILSKFIFSGDPRACVVSEEAVQASSSFQSKLQRQLHSMGLQTAPGPGPVRGNHVQKSSEDSLCYGTAIEVSASESLWSPVFCKFEF